MKMSKEDVSIKIDASTSIEDRMKFLEKAQNQKKNSSNGDNSIKSNSVRGKKTVELTEEMLEKLQEEAKESKKTAEESGEEVSVIRRDVAKIEKLKGYKYSTFLREKVNKLKDREQEIMLSGICPIDYLEFCALHADIRHLRNNPSGKELIDEIIVKLLKEQRIEESLQKPQRGHWIYIPWSRKFYKGVPEPGSVGVSEGTDALILETVNAVKAETNKFKQELLEKQKEMTQKPAITEMLDSDGKAIDGIYWGYLPSDKKRKLREAYFTVRVEDQKIIKPIDATGSLQGLFKELKSDNSFITVSSLRKGKLVLKVKLSEKKQENLQRFLKRLTVATYVNYSSLLKKT